MPVQFTNTEHPDLIELRNISQTFDKGKTWTIKELNLLIEDLPEVGELVGILGASGCGKSTVLRYIAGLLEPTEGHVLIGGQPRTPEQHVGMVFQKYSSFPWMTVLDNVAYPLKLRGISKRQRSEQAMEMVKLVGLGGHEHKWASDKQLSGGQLQRVAIARSLVNNPRVLLLDEPFGALDRPTRLDMQQLLLKVWRELHSTIILVTHDIEEAVLLCQEIYIMRANPGQIEKRFYINLPSERDTSVRRSTLFASYSDAVDQELQRVQFMRLQEAKGGNMHAAVHG